MQAAASEYNCLRIVNEVRIDRLEKGEGCVIGWSGEAGYSSRMLIGADGMNSNVRTFLNPNPPTRTHFRWGLRRHFQIAPWCDEVEVYWGNEIEAYVTPVGRETINLAFLCNRSILDRHLPKTDRMRSCLERFPILQKRLTDAQPVDEIRAIGPLEQPVRQTVGDGVVLLGDSAGYLDAITGEGISLALGSALLFEHIVIPRLTANPRGMLSAMELRPFSTLQTRQFQNYARFARLALYFSDKSRWLEAAIGFLGSRPRLFQYLLSCNLGTAELHPSAFPLVFGSEPHRRKL
jgi:flavin-dependent dehydrogenase